MPTDEAEIAAELAKQVPILKKEKASTSDKELRDIATYANDLRDHTDKMAARRAKLEGDRGANPADIKDYNEELGALKREAAAVSKRCQPYRGKTDTPKAVVKIFDVITRMQRISQVSVKQ